MRKLVAVAMIAGMALGGFGAYDVRRPSDDIKPEWNAANPGRWTLDVNRALETAKANGKYTILLNTGSWWCPFCETLEEMVLTSQAWKEYVAENGFYLAMLDFPYRGAVKEDEQWKSYHPEFGNGWGFKCWLMNPEYLAEIGLSEAEGLQAIMDEYEMQKALGENTAGALTTITNCLTKEEFTYRKVGYPTIIVYGPDGRERGRTSFPWYSKTQVTASEAQESVIQSIRLLVNGRCSICEDPLGGTPPTSASQKYGGFVKDAAGGTCGTIDFKLSKMNSKGVSKVSGSVVIGGKKLTLRPSSQKVTDFDQHVNFTAKLNGRELSVWVKFGLLGLTGEVTEKSEACCGMPNAGPVLYRIEGGRHVFGAKDDVAKECAATCPKGTWGVVLKPADKVAPSAFARGNGALSLAIRSKGKAKITGTLGDGTKVSVSSQVIVGDSGMSCLPVYIPLYGKKGGFGFVAWFQNGKLLCFEDVSQWVCADRKHPFTSVVTPMFTMSDGMGDISEEQELTLANFDGAIGGLKVVGDPTLDEVEVSRTKWRGTELTSFKATCTKSTGLLKGTMKFKVLKANGRTKTITGTFTGVVMGGSGYGSVVVKNEGSWSVKIAVCGGCSD